MPEQITKKSNKHEEIELSIEQWDDADAVWDAIHAKELESESYQDSKSYSPIATMPLSDELEEEWDGQDPIQNEIEQDGLSADPIEEEVQESGLENDPIDKEIRHDFSTTHFAITDPEVIEKLEELQSRIAEEDIHDEGIEGHFHITSKYGLHTSNVEEVKQTLRQWVEERQSPIIKAKLGEMSLFENPEHDVIKVDIDSPDLHALNYHLASNLEHTDTHPEYHPHLTLGFVNSGYGHLLESGDGLDGHEIELHELTFSDKQGNEHKIDLRELMPKEHCCSACEHGLPCDAAKSLQMKVKSEEGSGTCKQGERSDLTGCTPASGEAGTPKETDESDKGTEEKFSPEVQKYRDDQEAWQQRQDRREEVADKINSDFVGESSSPVEQRRNENAPAFEPADDFSTPEERQEYQESVSARVKTTVDDWKEAFGEKLQSSMKDIGATDKELAKINSLVEKVVPALEKAASKIESAVVKRMEHLAKGDKLEDEPEGPLDITPEEYQALSEQEQEKYDADYEKATEKHDKWQERVDALNDRDSELSDKVDEAQTAFDTLWETHKEKIGEEVQNISDRVSAELESADENDPEPQEPNESEEDNEKDLQHPQIEPSPFRDRKSLFSYRRKDLGWSFHGIECDKSTFDKWKSSLAGGKCPWCGKPVRAAHNNQNKHLQACPSRPTSPVGSKSLQIRTKDQGQPCKQGEAAARTGCIPANGESTSPNDRGNPDHKNRALISRVTNKAGTAVKTGVSVALNAIDNELRGGGSLILQGLKSMSPSMVMYGISRAVTSAYGMGAGSMGNTEDTMEEVFEAAMAQHSVGGAHAIGVITSKALVAGEKALLSGVKKLLRKFGIGSQKSIDEKEMPEEIYNFFFGIARQSALEIKKAILEEISTKKEPKYPQVKPSPFRNKAMSWLNNGSGGALVPPAKQGGTIKPKRNKILPSPFANRKSLNGYHSKATAPSAPVVSAPTPSVPGGSAKKPKASKLGAGQKPGVPFEGPSGRWFVVREADHRVVPTKNPNAQEKQPKQPGQAKHPLAPKQPRQQTDKAKEKAEKEQIINQAVDRAFDAADVVKNTPDKVTAQHVKEIGDALLSMNIKELRMLKEALGIDKIKSGRTKQSVIDTIKKEALEKAGLNPDDFVELKEEDRIDPDKKPETEQMPESDEDRIDLGSTESEQIEDKPQENKVKRLAKPEDSEVFNKWLNGDMSGKELAFHNDSDGPTDDMLASLASELGYDAKPEVVDEQDMDKLIVEGGEELFRGVKGVQFADAFRQGDYFAGLGMYGNGTYTVKATIPEHAHVGMAMKKSGSKDGYEFAQRYTISANTPDGVPDGILRMVLKKDAKVARGKDWENLQQEQKKAQLEIGNQYKQESDPQKKKELQRKSEIFMDMGRFASLNGWDAFDAGHVVILNRGSCVVQNTPAKPSKQWSERNG